MKKNKFLAILIFFLFCQNMMAQRGIIIDPVDGNPITYTWYRDYDLDTFGDPNYTISTNSPQPPYGFVANADDCDDYNENIGNAIWWYKDFDGDGYGFITYNRPIPGGLTDENGNPIEILITLENSDAIKSCEAPFGYVSNALDCNDRSNLITFQTWYGDSDGDGFGNPNDVITSIDLGECYTTLAGYVVNNTDCDDTNAEIHPNVQWFIDQNSDGMYNAYSEPFFQGCIPPNSDYIAVNYDENYNWIHVSNYNLSGNMQASSRVYYDDLGKATVSLSKDFLNNKMWSTEIVYDNFGRPFKTSFPTISENNFKKIDVLSNTSAKTQYLDPFYNDTNPHDPYQATATQPYTEVEYDKLNPGNVIKSFGGNQIAGEWKSGYSYTVPAAQEMYYLFGHNFFDGPVVSGKEEIITKFYKTVSVDANGYENVAFSDGEGKTLAVARSGLTIPATINPYPVHSLIGTQGYVDVCIPPGITSGITLLGGASNYDVYNLRQNTGIPTTDPLTGGNCYRIVAKVAPTTDPKVFVTQSTGALSFDSGAKGISYSVNYYDFSFNIYDKTGRLTKSVQPNAFKSTFPTTFSIRNEPSYIASNYTLFSTLYQYNTLGQVTQVSNRDEGTSKFAYRKDGQIRYSQSALQASSTEIKVSYTNYDNLSRPIESGVLKGAAPYTAASIWTAAIAGVDNNTLVPTTANITPSERTFTIYDDVANTTGLSVIIPTTLSLATLQPAGSTYASNQHNLAGNVAVTYKADNLSTITNITWYSYDIYGRVEWLVQYDRALGGVKTIDYVYDIDGNVKQVIFQDKIIPERFTHQYSYDANSRLIKVETAAGSNAFTEDAQYNYNISGQLNRVRIGEIVQGIDYVYTLGGALKSINHPSLETTKDPGKDGLTGTPNALVTPDLFGITLDYFQGDYNRAGTNIITSSSIASNYSGNIMGSRWAIKPMDMPAPLPTANQQGYLYEYNRNNWLKDAKYGTTDNSGTITLPVSPLPVKHSEQGLEYDSNGNITRLKRSNNAGATVDDLKYNYTYAGTNRLNRVTDAVSTSFPNDIDSGQLANNYVYNVLGQLISNRQEKTHYVYNTQGLVIEIRQGAATYAASSNVYKFYYNELGHRIRKEAYTAFTTLQNTTYYVLDASGNAMAIYYKESGGTIKQTELPIYGASRVGVCNKSGSNYVKYYQLTDHLGNVRAVANKNPTNPAQVLVASYADYYPFGEQLQNRNSNSGNYRYAFQGQEYDPETQMEAFQLRLWDGRLGRWLSPDPYGQYASPYLGMGNNPINGVDPDGGWFWPPSEGTFENGYVHTDSYGSWTFQDNKWLDNTGEGWDFDHGTVFLNDVNVGFNMQTNNYFSWVDGNSRLQLPAVYMPKSFKGAINEADIARDFIGDQRIYCMCNTPTTVDCSRFTGEVAKLAGYNLPRVAFDQANWYKSNGKWSNNLSDAKEGDHIFWTRGHNAYHTGIVLKVNNTSIKVIQAQVNGYRPGSIKVQTLMSNGEMRGFGQPFVGVGRR